MALPRRWPIELLIPDLVQLAHAKAPVAPPRSA